MLVGKRNFGAVTKGLTLRRGYTGLLRLAKCNHEFLKAEVFLRWVWEGDAKLKQGSERCHVPDWKMEEGGHESRNVNELWRLQRESRSALQPPERNTTLSQFQSDRSHVRLLTFRTVRYYRSVLCKPSSSGNLLGKQWVVSTLLQICLYSSLLHCSLLSPEAVVLTNHFASTVFFDDMKKVSVWKWSGLF